MYINVLACTVYMCISHLHCTRKINGCSCVTFLWFAGRYSTCSVWENSSLNNRLLGL